MTCHRIWILADMVVNPPWIHRRGECNWLFDGDKSPAESGVKRPHSTVAARHVRASSSLLFSLSPFRSHG